MVRHVIAITGPMRVPDDENPVVVMLQVSPKMGKLASA
jgi:hypothetical protein